MDLTLNLGQRYTWKFALSEFHPVKRQNSLKLQLKAIPVSNLFEHEAVLEHLSNAEQKGYPSIESLKKNILEKGFLHPILAHYLNSSNKWVLADGTHRLKAMEALKSKFLLGLNLLKENYTRDCWIKTLPALDSSETLEWLKTNYKKNISIKTLPFQERLDLLCDEIEPEVLAYINTTDQGYEIIDKHPEDRKAHLQLIKEIDDKLDHPDKDYKTRLEVSVEKDSFLLLPPPIDKVDDFMYLVDNEQLRRVKGSRTLLDVRIVYFPVPFDVLQTSETEIYSYVANEINKNLSENVIGTIYPKKSFTMSLDPSWYYHTLLIGDKRLFFKEAKTEKEKENLENFFTPVVEL